MKTPDEIKKGLECCSGVGNCFGECPYYIGNTNIECIRNKSADALAYIRQLERERDAAVADLTVIVKSCGEPYCEYCEYNDKHYCAGRCWTRNEGFKWRGVKEE